MSGARVQAGFAAPHRLGPAFAGHPLPLGAGHDGGRIVFQGTPGLAAARSALTGEHLAAYAGT
jgi:hypothetical protein